MTVGELPVKPKFGVHLHCWTCHGEYSAHRGDYFLSDPQQVMECCDEPLELLRKRTVYDDIASEDADCD